MRFEQNPDGTIKPSKSEHNKGTDLVFGFGKAHQPKLGLNKDKDRMILVKPDDDRRLVAKPVGGKGKYENPDSFVFKLNLETVDLTEGEYTMLVRPLWNPNTSDIDRELSLNFSGSEVEDVSGVDHADGKKLFQ